VKDLNNQSGPDPGTGGGLKVLVVDDNLDSASSLAQVLQLWGHDAKTAHDGQAAVQAAQDYQPDVVLLDIGLPGMDGYEVARVLRQKPSLAGMQLVALTGYGQDQDKQRSEQAGFEIHFTKPVDLGTLRKFLQERS
jgi:CheY-like chemotaxis protein